MKKLLILNIYFFLFNTCFGQFVNIGDSVQLAVNGRTYIVNSIKDSTIELRSNGEHVKLKYFSARNIHRLYREIEESEGTFFLDSLFVDTVFNLFDVFNIQSDTSQIVIAHSYLHYLKVIPKDSTNHNSLRSISINQCQIIHAAIVGTNLDRLDLTTCKINILEIRGAKIKFDFTYEPMVHHTRHDFIYIKDSEFRGFCSITLTSNNLLMAIDDEFNELYINHPIRRQLYPVQVEIARGRYKKISLPYNNSIRYKFNSLKIDSILELQKEDSITKAQLGNFEDIYFKKGSQLKVEPTMDVSSIPFTLRAILNMRISFSLPYPYRIHEDDEIRILNNLDLWSDKVESLPTTNQGLKSETLSWIDYQKAHYRLRYLKQNLSIMSFFEITWLYILELVVNNGYKGEVNFVFSVLALVMFWSVIYFGRFRSEINSYISGGSPVKRGYKLFNSSIRQNFIEGFKCAWFSFTVLINPQFPSKYFLFGNKLLVWIIAEWFVGVFLVLLFVVFIVSKYPFVKFLFGI